VEFRILGPLEVRDGGVVVPLGGPRQRAVLALLLTRAGEVVSADRLIDELWAGSPPETAGNVLQGYVSNLRKALGAGVIVTRGPGYAIELEPGQLDLHRFESLAESARGALEHGDPARAARELREALSLWHGPALADFAYEPFAQAEIARLEELRLAALERRLEADLVLGHHADLAGELEALVARHPLRERLRAHLMLSLYRSGRQAEALDAYQAARRALVDELGIEPGHALQELERAILRQDPALDHGTSAAPERRSAPAGADEPPAPEGSILVVPHEEAGLDGLLRLAEPLARRPPRELILALLLEPDRPLAAANAALQTRRAALASAGVPSRAAAFTSADRGEDLVLLSSEQDVDLLLSDAPAELLGSGALGPELVRVLGHSPCDVALLVGRGEGAPAPGPAHPILVPFGGAEHEWAAVELGAWIAHVHDAVLQLAGTAAGGGQRDASRLLARAALLVQRVVGVTTEPVLVPAGEAAVIEAAESAGLVVLGLSPRWREEGLGSARLAVARGVRPPALVVRRGPRPGGIAPRESLTRFTWTAATTGS
jgi:DNA-binding SARP family transcriptional activator